jgi:hypothetical protein
MTSSFASSAPPPPPAARGCFWRPNAPPQRAAVPSAMNALSILWENGTVFALLAAIGVAIAISNFFFVERTRVPSRSAPNRSGGAASRNRTSALLVANDTLLIFDGEQDTVRFSAPLLDLIVRALSKQIVLTLLVRVKNDAQQHAVTAAVQASHLPAAGFDMRRLLFCETANSQVHVARQLLPTVFASAHEPSVAEVRRLEAKRGIVRFCIALPAQVDSSPDHEQLATALGLSNSREKSE